ncbi:AAC(3) family N-acetyltransferase, partial [bacterium]|nr:AAC(3) family N-acetyltransferase [bacterium]
MDTYDQQALAADFQRLGLTAGDTVFVHSALSTLGHVEGGADTVIAALLSVVGHSGTLAAPAFTYEEDPDLFDIANQPRAWAG